MAMEHLFDRDRIPLVSSSHGLLAVIKLLAWPDRFDPSRPLGWHEADVRFLARLENNNQASMGLASCRRNHNPIRINDSKCFPLESGTPIFACSMARSGDRYFRAQLDDRYRFSDSWSDCFHSLVDCFMSNRKSLDSVATPNSKHDAAYNSSCLKRGLLSRLLDGLAPSHSTVSESKNRDGPSRSRISRKPR